VFYFKCYVTDIEMYTMLPDSNCKLPNIEVVEFALWPRDGTKTCFELVATSKMKEHVNITVTLHTQQEFHNTIVHTRAGFVVSS